jgi:transcription antitermination factor NusG
MIWFALSTKPRHEHTVAEMLAAKSVEAYLPLYDQRRQWGGRGRTVSVPLFPRYVFCRSLFEDRIKVLSTPGVLAVVGFGGKPAPVPDEEIAAVRRMLESGLPVLPCDFLAVGQRVRICGGPLRGLEGLLVRADNARRVVVNVESLCRGVSVEVDRWDVQAVNVEARPNTATHPSVWKAGARC